jgi:hypothetical protein
VLIFTGKNQDKTDPFQGLVAEQEDYGQQVDPVLHNHVRWQSRGFTFFQPLSEVTLSVTLQSGCKVTAEL